jgi:hypothetical protein
LTDRQLARTLERLRNPKPGGKVEAAQRFGVDLTLLMEQVKFSPSDRARRMQVSSSTFPTSRYMEGRLLENCGLTPQSACDSSGLDAF